ncbi:hypothetical protein BKA70DRAFT_1404325 [Coprinopsis sp. MPI-PUGE-AT-0042]|nr:hypothetical protein BKA70DRAFT_1404325 [Coprinopsis sp. MPI-PUGE-AT-0042]
MSACQLSRACHPVSLALEGALLLCVRAPDAPEMQDLDGRPHLCELFSKQRPGVDTAVSWGARGKSAKGELCEVVIDKVEELIQSQLFDLQETKLQNEYASNTRANAQAHWHIHDISRCLSVGRLCDLGCFRLTSLLFNGALVAPTSLVPLCPQYRHPLLRQGFAVGICNQDADTKFHLYESLGVVKSDRIFVLFTAIANTGSLFYRWAAGYIHDSVEGRLQPSGLIKDMIPFTALVAILIDYAQSMIVLTILDGCESDCVGGFKVVGYHTDELLVLLGANDGPGFVLERTSRTSLLGLPSWSVLYVGIEASSM